MKFINGELIYFLRDNKIHSAPIFARMQVDNAKDPGYACTNEQRELYEPWGLSGVFYNTCHGAVAEEEAFASKQELAEDLIK
jgi:hypothetical protein